jgi:hypothetical protein
LDAELFPYRYVTPFSGEEFVPIEEPIQNDQSSIISSKALSLLLLA